MNESIKRKYLEEDVSLALLRVGIKPSSSGYRYIKDSLLIILENPNILMSTGIVKGVYTNVAMKYDTSATSVERCIRHEAERLFIHSKNDILDQVFYNHEHKPTNKEFLAYLSEYIKLHTPANT